MMFADCSLGGRHVAACAQGSRGHAQPGWPVRAAQSRGGRRRLGQPGRAGGRPRAGDPGAARPRAHDHRPQRFAGRAVRPVDQPLSRLRAWLRLLLRPAEPRPSGPVGRARFRDQDLRQARGGGPAAPGAGAPRLCLQADLARRQHRPLPAAGAPPADHAPGPRGAGRGTPPGRHRHQVGPGHPRHRPAGADGARRPRPGLRLGHHARRRDRPHAGAARLGTAPAARGDPRAGSGRRSPPA